MASAFGFNFDSASAQAVGLNALSGASALLGAFGTRAIQNANADAQNIVRGANNELRRANFSLAATMRQINNQRIARAASDQADAVTTTSIRAQNAFQAGRLDAGLREAEQLGAQAAQAAASGVGGGSVDAVRATLQLRNARLQEAAMQQGDAQQYDLIRQRAGIIEKGIQSTDLRPMSMGLDFSQSQGATGSGFSLIGNLLGGLVDTDAKKATLNTFLGSVQRTAPTVDYGYVDGVPFYSPPAPNPALTIKPV